MFRNNIRFYGEELLAPRPTPKEDHPLSAVRDCLFKIFPATLLIGVRSSLLPQPADARCCGDRDTLITEEINRRLKSGNVCCHSLRNLLSSSLLYKNLKIKIYRTKILPVLYWCETWSLTLREERSLRVFENRALRRIFGPKKDKVKREWRKRHNAELNDL
jgi:hypothetical protein